MRALVTGASGFIGSTLIEELNTLGFDVKALMRKSSSVANLENLKFERTEGDLSDFESMKRAVKDVDYVFHLAGIVSAIDPKNFFEHNTLGTQRLAQAVAESRPGLTRMVFVSSMAAGGPSKTASPKRETEEDSPVSIYGESKLQAERELLRYKSVYPISIIRPPMVYGPRDKATFFFFQSVARNVVPMLKGLAADGHQYHTPIHARDLARGIVQAALPAKDKVSSGEIFYLAGDEVISYEALMDLIAEKMNRSPWKIRIPRPVFKAVALGSDAVGRLTRKTPQLTRDKLNEALADFWVCSNEKAKGMLGFKPEYDLTAGLSHAIEWYRRQKWI